ncbi:helix-turn-helix transcriptional regulator [Micromonospora sp. CPCC 205371]|nr:helix-turn-helix transcriptional regulator [Micromonospora sp. CPCC 205371]
MARGVYRRLGIADGMQMYEVRCLVDHAGWQESVLESEFQMILSRSGAYLSRVNGRETFADATYALLIRPDDESSVAHPLGSGDVFTGLKVPAVVLAERADGQEWLTRRGWEGAIDDRLDLRHRTLVTACRRGIDDFETSERLHSLMSGVLALTGQGDDSAGTAHRRPATHAAHRRLAHRACEVLAGGGYHLGLNEVARAVNSSPHHLSRVFREVMGQTMTAYRNRLRVRAVLSDLQEGASNLRELTSEYGFADQAHLTRVVGRHLGQTPTAIRRTLSLVDGDLRS